MWSPRHLGQAPLGKAGGAQVKYCESHESCVQPWATALSRCLLRPSGLRGAAAPALMGLCHDSADSPP